MKMDRMKRKYSFRFQLTVIILGVTFTTLILFFFVFQGVKRIILRQYSDEAIQSVRTAAENMDNSLNNIENVTDSILLNHDLLEDLRSGNEKQFLARLNSYFTSSLYMEGIYVMDESNYWYVGANVYEGTERFPKAVLEDTQGEFTWLPTREVEIQILSGKIPRAFFSMGRKIVDVNTLEVLGYLNVEVDEQVLKESYVNLQDESSIIIICDRQQNIISKSQPGDIEADLYAADILSQESYGSKEYQSKSERYVAIYAAFNRGQWFVIKNVPRAALYAEVSRLQYYVVTGMAAFFLILLFITISYSKKVSMPITKMIDQMKKVESGNLQVRVETDVNNELRDLGEGFNQMVQKIDGLMEEVIAAERNRSEMELEVLHAQINPHFLYNTLNTIRWMAVIKGEEQISSTIVALVKLLRVSISLGKSMITVREEVEYIENYLRIQRLRFDQRYDISYAILEEHHDILIPKLILQPIVENSLIYGIGERENNESILHIGIYTMTAGDCVKIVVEDNGPGISKEVQEIIFKDEKNVNKFSTVGLNNVNQRIKMYFGERYGLEIHSQLGQGTKIIIDVPARAER